MLDASYYASLGLADVLDKVLAGQRLSAEDGTLLPGFYNPYLMLR